MVGTAGKMELILTEPENPVAEGGLGRRAGEQFQTCLVVPTYLQVEMLSCTWRFNCRSGRLELQWLVGVLKV